MIYGMDLAIVGGDDRFTDRQSDAHAAFGVCGGGWSRRCSIEDTFQPVRCNSISMIPDMNLDLGIVSGEITLNRLFTSGMEISIFQKIDDDLLDQQWIHGNHIEITGYRDLDLIIRIAFADGGDCIEKHFFSDFRCLF